MIRGWGDLMAGGVGGSGGGGRMMAGGGGGGGFPFFHHPQSMMGRARFEEQYHCYSVAYADKAHLEVRTCLLLTVVSCYVKFLPNT